MIFKQLSSGSMVKIVVSTILKASHPLYYKKAENKLNLKLEMNKNFPLALILFIFTRFSGYVNLLLLSYLAHFSSLSIHLFLCKSKDFISSWKPK
jgi:hypothetical protein